MPPSFTCPSCKEELDKQPIFVVGIYSAWPADQEDIENKGHFSMRLSQKLIPLALIECPICGHASLWSYRRLKDSGIKLIFDGELDEG